MATTSKLQAAFSAIFQWRSINTRVVTFTLAIFLTGIWALTFYASEKLRKDLESLLSRHQFSTVSFIAEEVNAEFGARVEALKAFTQRITPELIRNPTALQMLLEQHPILHSFFNHGVAVAGLDGTVIADFPHLPGRIGANFIERDYVIGPLKEGKITIGRPVMSKLMHAPAFVIGVPIRDKKNKVIGVIGGVVDLHLPNFLENVTEQGYGKTGGYLLIAPQHKLVVTGTDKTIIMKPISTLGINELFNRFVQGYEGSGITIDSHGSEILASAKQIPVAGWIVVAQSPTDEIFAPIHDLTWNVLLAAIFLTLLAGSLIWWVLRRHLSPIFTTIRTMATLSRSDKPPQPLPIVSHDEIGELIGGFNHLLESLGHRDDALRKSRESFEWLAKETSIIAEIGRIVGATLDIEQVYERVATEARKLIPFDRLLVNRKITPDGQFIASYVSGIDNPRRRQGDLYLSPGSATGVVMKTRKGILIQPDDAEEIKELYPNLYETFKTGLRSTMSVPLISMDEVIGSMNFRSEKLKAYTEQDLQLAERIGMQVAGAIANAHLFTERQTAEKQLQDTLDSLRRAVGTTIQVMVSAVETRDPYTSGHQNRSADLARAIAMEMELPQDIIDAIRMAGSIHDIGKLSIPAEILSKPTKLSDIEFSLIKEHARKGYEMLKDVESPWPLAEIVHQHHERIDGSGYPRNLKGDEILIEARILAVADVVEAMASHRPYRPGLGIDAALNEIEKNSDIFYDMSVADACLRLFREKSFQLAEA